MHCAEALRKIPKLRLCFQLQKCISTVLHAHITSVPHVAVAILFFETAEGSLNAFARCSLTAYLSHLLHPESSSASHDANILKSDIFLHYTGTAHKRLIKDISAVKYVEGRYFSESSQYNFPNAFR